MYTLGFIVGLILILVHSRLIVEDFKLYHVALMMLLSLDVVCLTIGIISFIGIVLSVTFAVAVFIADHSEHIIKFLNISLTNMDKHDDK